MEAKKIAEICKCRGCGSRYVPEPLQSHFHCSHCQPLTYPVCCHSVSLHDACEACFKLYGRAHMRQLGTPAPAPKAKRITMTRKRLTWRR